MALDRLSGTVSAGLSIRVGDDNYNSPRVGLNASVSQGYAFGSSTGQANVVYSEELSTALSSTTTLTLDNSSLEDMFGNTSNFSNISAIRIQHAGTSSASSITIGGTLTVGFTAGTDQLSITLNPGDFFMLSINQSKQAVGAGETITITNNDGSNASTTSVDLLGD
jgi:hypothetical protein